MQKNRLSGLQNGSTSLSTPDKEELRSRLGGTTETYAHIPGNPANDGARPIRRRSRTSATYCVTTYQRSLRI
jgi:hypothetical protein